MISYKNLTWSGLKWVRGSDIILTKSSTFRISGASRPWPVAKVKTNQQSLLISPIRCSAKTLKTSYPPARIWWADKQSPPNGAKINKTAAKPGINHAELFNPASRVTIHGVLPCGFLHRGRKGDASLKFDLAAWGSSIFGMVSLTFRSHYVVDFG